MLKWQRFTMFCLEDGIDPNNPKVTKEDGSWEIYQPDGMGYPTVVLSSEE